MARASEGIADTVSVETRANGVLTSGCAIEDDPASAANAANFGIFYAARPGRSDRDRGANPSYR